MPYLTMKFNSVNFERFLDFAKAFAPSLPMLFLYNERRFKRVKVFDSAIAIMDEALAIAPNFNLAKISKDALNAQKKQD